MTARIEVIALTEGGVKIGMVDTDGTETVAWMSAGDTRLIRADHYHRRGGCEIDLAFDDTRPEKVTDAD